MSLIDRLNLHFKLGYRAVVEFAADEKQWVHAIDECSTFQQVCLVAKMLSDWLDQKAEDKQEDNTQEQQSDGSGEEDGESEEQQQQQTESGDDDNEEQQDFGSKGRQGDDEEEVEEEDDESPIAGDNGASDQVDEKSSTTQKAMEDAVKDLASTGQYGGQHHVARATGDLSAIVGIKTIRESFRNFEGYTFGDETKQLYTEFLTSTKKEVNHMVQRFEMKKSADAYARASQNKTGVLNTGKLHQYKLTEDIFLRQTVTPDGKSHGMVMIVDWSGSMSNCLIDTVKQLLVLVQFCRKVSIPFQVFTFTTPAGSRSRYTEDTSKLGTIGNDQVGLYEVLNSTAKKRVLDQDMLNLFSQASILERGNRCTGPFSDELLLGGTPLDNVLTMVPAIIDEFRAATKAQKVSFVALTDGASSPSSTTKKRLVVVFAWVMLTTVTTMLSTDMRPSRSSLPTTSPTLLLSSAS